MADCEGDLLPCSSEPEVPPTAGRAKGRWPRRLAGGIGAVASLVVVAAAAVAVVARGLKLRGSSGLSPATLRREATALGAEVVRQFEYHDRGAETSDLPVVIHVHKPEKVECESTCKEHRKHISNIFTRLTGLKQLYFIPKQEKSLGRHQLARKTVIVFHGVGVNPHEYLCYVYNGFRKAGGHGTDTYFVSVAMVSYAKMFAESRRRRRGVVPGETEYWGFNNRDPLRETNGSEMWMYGMSSRLPPNPDDAELNYLSGQLQASSYTAIDDVILHLAKKNVYPHMEEVVLIGHGAGAQLVQRYSVANQVDPKPGLTIRYVVANPSTYMYLTPERPTLPDISSVDDISSIPCSHYGPLDLPLRSFQFAEPDMAKVKLFSEASEAFPGEHAALGEWGLHVNRYPFGMDSLPPYFGEVTAEEVRRRFISRHVVYLAAYYDVCNYHLQNRSSCGLCYEDVMQNMPVHNATLDAHEIRHPLSRFNAAMAQGLTRVERAYAYWAHLHAVYGHHGNQEFHALYGKHDACPLFQTTSVAKALFMSPHARRSMVAPSARSRVGRHSRHHRRRHRRHFTRRRRHHGHHR